MREPRARVISELLPLQTERLALTSQRVDDAPWLARLISARGHGEVSEKEAAARIVARAVTPPLGIASIRLRTNGRPVGYVGLVVGRACLEEPELAYELFADFWGRGYATEAGAAMVEAAWAAGFQRLWLTTRPTNLASLRVAKKLGFQRDQVTEDALGEVVWHHLSGPAS